MTPPMSSLASVSRRDFGRLPDGRVVHEYTLDNGRGLSLSAINLGGIVTAIRCPDRDGHHANIVLGFAALADYVERNPHFGTLVGRYANRIKNGRFELDGQAHQLALNNPPNALHGGPHGFGTRWWAIEPQPVADDGSVALELGLVSEDGEEGYPGRLDVSVRYTLTADNAWRIDYRAATDRPTIVNLTHHGYFNLAGGGTVLDHHLTLAASRFAGIDAHLIPERLVDVAGTPFDFRQATCISARIRSNDPQLVFARGYDHHWLIDRPDHEPAGSLRFAARLEDPGSGRVLEIDTTEPGLQFYSGNFLDGSLVGSAGHTYRQGDGLCLETQHAPDSPNHPEFPSTVLRPGQVFTSSTVHRFSTDRATL
jgi:aldose 1-epimerase